MAKVVYLFVAGASIKNSFNTNIPMPLANNFIGTISRLKESEVYKRLIVSSDFKLIDSELTEFSNFIVKYNTIDEAMRMLYINGDVPKFIKFKNLIQLIFYFVESAENYRDNRYIQFLLTLVNENRKLPQTISLFSWNYDNQLEYAAKEIDKHLYDDTLDEENYFKINALRAAPYILKNELAINDFNRLDVINQILNEKEETIKFAWENNSNSLHRFRNDIMNEFIKKTGSTGGECIVVIGYSFPYVNHIVDKELMNKIKPNRIYIQNPDISISESISERFNLPHVEIVPVLNCDRFYIPNELFL